MLMRPSSRTIATATTATGRIIEPRKDAIGAT
jgi:hypothetical protein